VLRRADDALYRAKGLGRDRVCVDDGAACAGDRASPPVSAAA
jgi:hypothetical protein